MGKITTPKYQVEYYLNDRPSHAQSAIWSVAFNGKATDKNLEKWVNDLNKSFFTGGANYNSSVSAGMFILCLKATIIEQKTSRVIATYQEPVFATF